MATPDAPTQVFTIAEAIIRLHERMDKLEDSQQPPPADKQVLAYLARVDSALAEVKETLCYIDNRIDMLAEFASVVYSANKELEMPENVRDWLVELEADRLWLLTDEEETNETT